MTKVICAEPADTSHTPLVWTASLNHNLGLDVKALQTLYSVYTPDSHEKEEVKNSLRTDGGILTIHNDISDIKALAECLHGMLFPDIGDVCLHIVCNRIEADDPYWIYCYDTKLLEISKDGYLLRDLTRADEPCVTTKLT